MENQTNEEILFQRIMSSKAYRRGMIMYRLIITAVVAGGLAVTGMIAIVLGILLAAVAVIFGIISILVSLGNENTYTVYNTRLVLKRRGDYARQSVPLENIVSVKYRSAFYEKSLLIGTVTIKAKNEKGKIKSYKLKHIFDARPIIDFLVGSINGRNTDGGQDRK